MNDEKEYKAYRLVVKKRLNVNYHKQQSDLKKLEKAGQDLNLISASIATPQERIEQLKIEYKVRIGVGGNDFTIFKLIFCSFRLQELEEEYQRIIDKVN